MRQKQPLIALVMLSCITFACSSRQVYQATANTPPSADAININTATAEDLERLPRIGAKTAANIIKFRSENGPFRRPEEVMQVHGIGEKRFLEIRQYLRTE